MAIFFSTLFTGWWMLSFWWLIAPRFFPFSNPKNAVAAYPQGSFSRLQVLLYTAVGWVVIFAVASFLMPDGGVVEPSATDIIGMLAGIGAVIWLIVRSIKIGKARNVVLITATGDAMTSEPPSPPPRVIEPAPAAVELTAETQMLIEQEAKIRADQDKAFAEAQQAMQDKITALEAELQSAKADLTKTRSALDVIQNPPPKPQPPKPKPKTDFELGDDKVCLMKYRDSKGAVSTRPIIPRTLKANQSGAWVVSAVDIDAGRVKSFRIDRIECLAHNGQAWTEQDDIIGVIRTLETTID